MRLWRLVTADNRGRYGTIRYQVGLQMMWPAGGESLYWRTGAIGRAKRLWLPGALCLQVQDVSAILTSSTESNPLLVSKVLLSGARWYRFAGESDRQAPIARASASYSPPKWHPVLKSA